MNTYGLFGVIVGVSLNLDAQVDKAISDLLRMNCQTHCTFYFLRSWQAQDILIYII